MSIFTNIKAICPNIKALEAKAGISNGTIAKWDTSFPRADTLYKVAQVLGVSMEYLMCGKEAANAVTGNGNIIGDNNSHNTVTINGDGTRPLTEIEAELLRICGGLKTREKTELLTFAYELEKREG